jgi:hypothetical protein
MRTCGYCGEEYLHKNGFTKYCSSECAANARRQQSRQYSYKSGNQDKWYSDYRVMRTVKCKYCKTDFESDLLKKIFCTDECMDKWYRMMQAFRCATNVVYLIGYKINSDYYVKIGIATTFEGRFKRYSTDTPLLLRVFHLRQFDTIEDAKEIEKGLHIKTLSNQTEAGNEWRLFSEDELINLMIDVAELDKGREVNIDNEHISQLG